MAVRFFHTRGSSSQALSQHSSGGLAWVAASPVRVLAVVAVVLGLLVALCVAVAVGLHRAGACDSHGKYERVMQVESAEFEFPEGEGPKTRTGAPCGYQRPSLSLYPLTTDRDNPFEFFNEATFNDNDIGNADGDFHDDRGAPPGREGGVELTALKSTVETGPPESPATTPPEI